MIAALWIGSLLLAAVAGAIYGHRRGMVDGRLLEVRKHVLHLDRLRPHGEVSRR